MWFTVLFFLAGVPLGYLLRNRAWAVKLTGLVSTWVVRVLLFLLGLTLGANEALLSQLDTLGVWAVAIATAAGLGSLVGVRFLGVWLRLEAGASSPGSGDQQEPGR